METRLVNLVFLALCVCVRVCLSLTSSPPCLLVVLRVNVNQGLLPCNGELQREMEVR